MLYQGERIGMGGLPKVEIAVDPLDGTTLTAQGRDGAITVIALAEPGTLLDPGPCMYMEKLTVGPGVNPSAVGLRCDPFPSCNSWQDKESQNGFMYQVAHEYCCELIGTPQPITSKLCRRSSGNQLMKSQC